jgi:superfamily II DNA or RNA helicase/HKD family nuclease
MSAISNDKDILPSGIYDALLDERLRDILIGNPDLRVVLAKIDPEEQPSRYAGFLSKVIERALEQQVDFASRLDLCNKLIELIAGSGETNHLNQHKLVNEHKSILIEITPPNYAQQGMPRPETSIFESSLFTGSPREPQLVRELLEEMYSSDSVDLLVSFIKWSGLRLLMPAFEDLRLRNIPVRVITTSYMGASDSSAIEWLAQLPNVSIRLSYDTERTRLHAKAYHFHRKSGFSTAYIGSANISHAAITSGLEWMLKVTAQDMQHILNKFCAEFETYWNSHEFVPFDPNNPQPLREALLYARNKGPSVSPTFFDLRPYPFQERILDELEAERNVHHNWRNLVIAATGTGKTVIAAFDYKKFFDQRKGQARLLFIAHRREILEQAIGTFRNILRIADFGELLVGPHDATRIEHLFCSVDMLNSRQQLKQVEENFYDYLVIDEVHHGPATSYRHIFDHFKPSIMLGLTATPERMDGQSVAADFGNRFSAEIRLPEALEEKLLCPFHYFGVADPVAVDADHFWKNGKYDVQELEKVYTGAHALAQKRLKIILDTLLRYEPDLTLVKGIGFCVSVNHAEYMAQMFNEHGIASDSLIGQTNDERRTKLLDDLRAGDLTFLFTRDVLNEGLDIPDVNTVMFLRPTESLTVFLQQLGRGLRHAPGKDCLTVLDFVGQVHRRYRIDSKLKALLPKTRYPIDREVELEFPHLPSGCSIQLDRVAREYVLNNIRENLRKLSIQVPERIKTFENESNLPLTFVNFISYHDYEPETLLINETWSGWKAKAGLTHPPQDPDINKLKKALLHAINITGPRELTRMRDTIALLQQNDITGAINKAGNLSMAVHYRLWGKPGAKLNFQTMQDSFKRLADNTSILADLDEVLTWVEAQARISGVIPELPFSCQFELHAQYGSVDIKAILGQANFESSGQTGIGVLHFKEIKAYVLFITYQKTEREFSPTTMYADYPISRDILHWESQSNTTQNSATGQNLIRHKNLNYTILIFARDVKTRNGITIPYTYLGPAELINYESERPIRIIWRLRYPMPAKMFEENRRGG